MKTPEQIAIEIKKLEAVLPLLVVKKSIFGQDHEAAIKAQIRVLTERMTFFQVEAAFPCPLGADLTNPEVYINMNATDAVVWMNDKVWIIESLVDGDGWQSLTSMAESTEVLSFGTYGE